MATREPEIIITADVGEAHADFVEQHLRRAWPLVEQAPGSLSVAIVDDQAMSELHERFLKLSGPTDVLTFELDHDAAGNVTEGEVIICLGEAERQAVDRGHSIEQELLLYALHGLLHLSGYDDLDEAGYEAMHAKEDEILTRIGVGAIFGRGGA